jgi:hypothetical protein
MAWSIVGMLIITLLLFLVVWGVGRATLGE